MEHDGYMTVRDAATFLKVTTDAIYTWLQDGRLKGYKAGSDWRIKREDIEKFLKPNTV